MNNMKTLSRETVILARFWILGFLSDIAPTTQEKVHKENQSDIQSWEILAVSELSARSRMLGPFFFKVPGML